MSIPLDVMCSIKHSRAAVQMRPRQGSSEPAWWTSFLRGVGMGETGFRAVMLGMTGGSSAHILSAKTHMHTFMDPLFLGLSQISIFFFFHCTHHSNMWLPHQHTFTLLLSECASSLSVSAAAVSHVLACVDPFLLHYICVCHRCNALLT